MLPLPRLLAMALLVVLAALLAILAVPAWSRARTDAAAVTRSATSDPAAASPASVSSGAHKTAPLAQRTALVLAAIACAVCVALVFTLARSPAPTVSQAPFGHARTDMTALTRLAQTSAAQGEELSRERDVRRRAEEDAQLKQRLLAQSLEEKIRIGRDLHDGIIQSLYAVGLTIESVRVLLQSDPAEAGRRLERTRAAINDTIRDVRAYIVGLAPENLRRTGFAQALEAQLAELRGDRATRFELKIDTDTAALLSTDQSVQVLQIAREAVSNALRHGEASVITLRMHTSDREICFLIQDDGRGFDPAARREGGHGLTNLSARASGIGAQLRIESQPGHGARVVATLPILQPAAV